MKASHPQYPLFIRGEFFGGVEDIEDGASRTLLALERFERPSLQRTPRGLDERAANANAALRIGKSCAGLARAYRIDAPELRGRIARGELDRRTRTCFDWVLSGMRGCEIHELYNAWGLSIHALARTVARSYGGRHALARWLNLWGADPSRALPEHDGRSRRERARERRRGEIEKWAAALRTPGARKAQGCLEEAKDKADPHPRRSVLGHACTALGCLRGATAASLDGRPVTRFAGPEMDESTRRLPRSLARGLGIGEDGRLARAQDCETLRERYGITGGRQARSGRATGRILRTLEEVNDETDATPQQMALLVEQMIEVGWPSEKPATRVRAEDGGLT